MKKTYLSVRMNEEELDLWRSGAKERHISLCHLIRSSVRKELNTPPDFDKMNPRGTHSKNKTCELLGHLPTKIDTKWRCTRCGMDIS